DGRVSISKLRELSRPPQLAFFTERNHARIPPRRAYKLCFRGRCPKGRGGSNPSGRSDRVRGRGGMVDAPLLSACVTCTGFIRATALAPLRERTNYRKGRSQDRSTTVGW